MRQRSNDVRLDTALPQEVRSGLRVEEQVEAVDRLVADGDDGVRVLHVVDERDVLVTDALDAVLAEAVVEHGRALEGLHGANPGAEAILEPVARAERSGRARRGDERGE